MRGRLAAAAAGLAAIIALGLGEAAARDPKARIAFVGGGRRNLGELGERYELGYVLGGEAGWQPGLFGIGWTLLFGNVESTSPENVEGELLLVEMDFSARARVPLGTPVIAFTPSAGLSLLRTSVPTEPGPSRHHVGPSAGVGFEFLVGGTFLVNLGVRASILVPGPRGVTVLLSLGYAGD